MAGTKPTDENAPLHREDLAVFNDNKLKLGIFGSNCNGATMYSAAAGSDHINWQTQVQIAQRADQMGIEMFVPIGRWRGYGGQTDPHGTCYEPFTWAAGLAQATEQIVIVATTHVPAKHPIVLAKEAVTIDHIANGRFGINAVMGWFTTELGMFGIEQREHDERYAMGAEWIEILRKLWAEEEFDWDSKYFQMKGAQSHPGLLSGINPILLNAGNSPAGQEFSAKYCDFNFITFGTVDDAKQISDNVRRLAREEYKREIGIMTYGTVICRDTEKEAKQVFDHVMELADWDAAQNVMDVIGVQSSSFNDVMRERFISSAGGTPFVGTPEQIVEQFQALSDAGVDGVLFGLLDYYNELEYLDKALLPLLREAGLRNS